MFGYEQQNVFFLLSLSSYFEKKCLLSPDIVVVAGVGGGQQPLTCCCHCQGSALEIPLMLSFRHETLINVAIPVLIHPRPALKLREA